MIDEPIQHDDGVDVELTGLERRLRADGATWRAPAPAGLHQRTMAAIAAEPMPGADAIASIPPGRTRRGLALAAACVAVGFTAWAAMQLPAPATDDQYVAGGPTATDPPEGHREDGDGGFFTAPAPRLPGPVVALFTTASLDRELLALETDARNATDLITRRIRLMSGQEQ